MTTRRAGLASEDLLTSREVARRLSIGVKTLFRLVRAGVVPQPIRLSRKILRWRVDEFERWLKKWRGEATE